MRAVIQKVSSASVHVIDGESIEEVGAIGQGYVVLLGVDENDEEADGVYIAEKIKNLRIFEDENGKLNLAIEDVAGEVLMVSQFTLLGDTRKGRRPSFSHAARPEKANLLYEKTVSYLRDAGITVKTGRFQMHMSVNIVNDGPVTLLLDSKKQF